MTIQSHLTGIPALVNMANADACKAVQEILLAAGFDLGANPIDGDFGALTRTALKTFKRDHALNGESVDIGPLTAHALDEFKALPPRPRDEYPPWLRTAIENIGTLEVPGSGDNPKILAMAALCGGYIAANYKHDEIPWCKMFVEYCLRKNGFKGNDTLWALDSRKIGTALTGPAVGAIASKTRSGGGHTFIVAGRDAHGNIVGVGGNQSDSVSRATFDPSVLKYNWPAGYPEPVVGFSKLPVVPSAKFSKSEA